MNISNRLVLKDNTLDGVVEVGEITDKLELDELFRLRYKVYSKKGYIVEQKYKNELEIDEYDTENKCKYFGARFNGKFIGTIRMIIDDVLPTEKYFKFNEPDDVSKIKRSNRCEFGRFIIIPPDKEGNIHLPRGLIMLLMFNTLCKYSKENGFEAGYSFVKKSLKDKMDRLGMPIKTINNYEQRYNSGVLLNYFNDISDPVIPVYFFLDDFIKYLENKVNNSLMFDNRDNFEYILKSNLYNYFLRKIGYI